MWLICFLMFSVSMPMSIIIPMLPYIGERYGASPFEVSVLFATMPLMTIVSAPWWGRLSDRIGRRPVFVMSLATSSASLLLFALADSMIGLLIARGIQGLSTGIMGTAFAMVADTVAPSHRARTLGRLSGSTSLGFILGPVVGGLLMSDSVETFSHAPVAYFGTALCVVATVLSYVFVRETRGQYKAPRVPHGPDSAEHAARPMTRWTLVLFLPQFFIAGCAASLMQFAAIYWLQDTQGWSPSSVSFAMAASGIAYFLAATVFVALFTRLWGDERAYLAAVIVDACGMAAFLLLQSQGGMALGGIAVYCLGNGIWSTIVTSLLSRNVPPDKMGVMMGLGNGTMMAGRVFGPIAAGAILVMGPAAPFALCLGLSVIVIFAAAPMALAARRTTA